MNNLNDGFVCFELYFFVNHRGISESEIAIVINSGALTSRKTHSESIEIRLLLP